MGNMRDQNSIVSVYGFDLDTGSSVGTVLMTYTCPAGKGAICHSWFVQETDTEGGIGLYFVRPSADDGGTESSLLIEDKRENSLPNPLNSALIYYPNNTQLNIHMNALDRLEVRVTLDSGFAGTSEFNVLLNIEEVGPMPMVGTVVEGTA